MNMKYNWHVEEDSVHGLQRQRLPVPLPSFGFSLLPGPSAAPLLLCEIFRARWNLEICVFIGDCRIRDVMPGIKARGVTLWFKRGRWKEGTVYIKPRRRGWLVNKRRIPCILFVAEEDGIEVVLDF